MYLRSRHKRQNADATNRILFSAQFFMEFKFVQKQAFLSYESMDLVRGSVTDTGDAICLKTPC